MKNAPFTPPPSPTMSWVLWEDRQELLFLPAGLYVLGLLKGDVELLGWALAIWAVAYAVWCPWTLWKFTDAFPRDDNWRCVAGLVLGGSAWLLALPLLAFLGDRLGLSVAFPAIYGAAGFGLIVARRRGPWLSPLARRWFVGVASAIAAVWTLIFAIVEITMLPKVTARTLEGMDEFMLFLSVPLLLLAGFLAVRLSISAFKGFTHPRPVTAESLLSSPG